MERTASVESLDVVPHQAEEVVPRGEGRPMPL